LTNSSIITPTEYYVKGKLCKQFWVKRFYDIDFFFGVLETGTMDFFSWDFFNREFTGFEEISAV